MKSDSLFARVIHIEEFKECYLISVVNRDTLKDTIYVVSEKEKVFDNAKMARMTVGENYYFIIEQALNLPSPPKHFSYECGKSILWTNKQPYSKLPRMGVNTKGEYIELLHKK